MSFPLLEKKNVLQPSLSRREVHQVNYQKSRQLLHEPVQNLADVSRTSELRPFCLSILFGLVGEELFCHLKAE